MTYSRLLLKARGGKEDQKKKSVSGPEGTNPQILIKLSHSQGQANGLNTSPYGEREEREIEELLASRRWGAKGEGKRVLSPKRLSIKKRSQGRKRKPLH